MSDIIQISNKKAITLIYKSYLKELETRDLNIQLAPTTFLNKMRCLELIDFIKIQESRSFSFNIQIVFDEKYNLNSNFFKMILFNEDTIHVFTHGLTSNSDIYLLSTPIYLLKFQINPLVTY